MKISIIIIFFISGVNLLSQSISIFDIEESDFPTFKAKVFAFDAFGEAISDLSRYEINLTENGRNITDYRIECPPAKQITAISSVLTIDISGSMYGEGLDNAKAAARAWVNAMPLGKSECAITAFDNDNYLINDFTKDRICLLEAIDKLEPDGATDFDSGFLKRSAGAFPVVENARYKKVIVFLTDGFAGGNKEEIIAKARHLDAIVYCVTLNNSTPQILRDIAIETGGSYFSNITNKAQAEDVYRTILMLAQNSEPCRIEWQTFGCSTHRNIQIEILDHHIKTDLTYSVPYEYLPRIEYDPTGYLNFNNVGPGDQAIKKITLKAMVSDIHIDKISSDNTEFSISDYGGVDPPFTIEKGSKRELAIAFTPSDSSLKFVQFTIDGDACMGGSFFARGGNPNIPIKQKTIELVSPNGGDELISGGNSEIVWKGIPPEEKVKIEYSTDNGRNWFMISENNTGGIYNWKNIPNTPSDKCLIKITQSGGSKNIAKREVDIPSGSYISECLFDPTGKNIAIVLNPGKLFIYESNTLHLLCQIDYERDMWVNPQWFPDGIRIATKNGQFINIWDVNSGVLIDKLSGHTKNIYKFLISPDGSKICSIGNDKKLIIWNTENGSMSYSLFHDTNYAPDLEWSPDGTKIASDQDDKIRIIDSESGKINKLLSSQPASIMDIKWSPDGTRIASSDVEDNLIIWDIDSGEDLHSYDFSNEGVKDIQWSPDGSKISARPPFEFRIWDVESEDEIFHSDYISVISPDSKFIAYRKEGLYVFNTETNSEIKVFGSINFPLHWNFNSMQFDFPNYDFSSGKVNSEILIFDTDSVSITDTISAENKSITALSWSPNGNKLLCQEKSDDNKNSLMLWSSDGTGGDIQNDISDKNWVIISPLASAADINFGRVINGGMKDSVFSGFITNIGKASIRIDKIEIMGKNADNFALASGSPPFNIPINENRDLEFRFSPDSPGQKTANIIIVTQTDTLSYSITGEGIKSKIEVINDIVDLGQVPMFTKKEKVIKAALQNNSKSNVTIERIVMENSEISQFSLETPINSFELMTGKSYDLTIGFNPVKEGRTDGKILVYCKDTPQPAKIKLFGVGLPVYATIYGAVTDREGLPIDADIGWELIRDGIRNINLGTSKSFPENGKYEIKLPVGKDYVCFFSKKGYSGYSEMVALSEQTEEIDINKNIILKEPWDGSITINNIFFEYNKSDLKPESFSELDRLVDLLKDYPNVKVEISGHTDNKGSAAYNQKLSEDRALSVVGYLIEKGIKDSYLIAKGYGESKPVADNKSDEGQAKNRRVEFKFLK